METRKRVLICIICCFGDTPETGFSGSVSVDDNTGTEIII